MSTLSTQAPAPGDALSVVPENARMTSVTTGTTDINQANVLDAGIARRTLAVGVAHVKALHTTHTTAGVTASYTDLRAMQPGAAASWDGRQDLAHGGGLRVLPAAPIPVVEGDLVRLFFNVAQVEYSAAYVYPQSGAHVCWIVQPFWDITDAGLTHWVPLPGDIAHGDLIIDPGIGPTEGYGVSLAGSVGVCRVDLNYASGATDPVPENILICGSHFHIHTGAAISVYGVKFMVSGPYELVNFQNALGNRADTLRPLLAAALPDLVLGESDALFMVMGA